MQHLKKEKRAEGYAWVLFFSINFIIFLPRFILEIDQTVLFPFGQFLEKSPYEKLKFLVTRANFDFFRLSFDLLLITAALLFLRKYLPVKTAGNIFGAIYTVVLLYSLYFNAFEKIYQTRPLFYNDLISLKTAFLITWDSLGIWFFPALAGFVGLIAVLFILAKIVLQFFARIKISAVSYFIIGALLLLSAVTLYTQGLPLKTNATVQFFLYSLSDNTVQSFATYRDFQKMDMEMMKKKLSNVDEPLPKTPNIYFIFIESYGRFAYDNREVYEAHQPVLDIETKKLRDAGYHIASNFSVSPVTGGISWLAYSSVLYGFEIDKQGTYFALLRDTVWYHYPHWVRMLAQNGYTNYRLSSIATNERMTVPWELYSKFYAVDRWITWKDLHYHGKVYGFGPSPPDQYALHFAQEMIDSAEQKPYSLFFITQNSHNPFFSPIVVAQDWRSLNDGTRDEGQRSRFLDKPAIEDYSEAINYQVKYLSDFIRKRNNKQDIYILAGDHQPPLLTNSNESFETPFYLISGDTALISNLHLIGYQKRLLIDTTAGIMQHADVYHHYLKVMQMLRTTAHNKEVRHE